MRSFLCILLMGWMWLPFAARAQNPTITAAEYFLDADPGVGSGKSFPVPASANPSVQTQVSLQGLPLGFHTLSVRFKDSNEFWSVARTRVFLIESPLDSEETNTLAGLEYFINTDPGPGNGTKVNITPGTEASVAIPVSLSGLSEGFHSIGVRFQDDAGKWSTSRARIFLVQSAISEPPLLPVTEAEYFIDTDPGPGLGKSLSMSSGNNPQVVGNIATEGLETGFHTIGVRFKRQDNLWGLAKSRLFYVNDEDFDKPVMVDYLEYFFDDDDLGEGKATSIALNQPASAISVDAMIAVADLPKGSHTISVRIRDNKGLWSLVETKDFIVGDPEFTTPPKPDLAELPNLEGECVVNLADLNAPTATAEDGSTVIGTVDESLFPITKQGNTEITWTYTDINGLKSTQKQVIVIEDNEAPSLTAPAKLVLNLGENQCSFSEVLLGEAVASDNCGEPVVSNNAPQAFGVGTTVVTWTATDAAGNQAQATQEVEIIDVIPPTILAPANIFIQVPAGQDFAENVGLGQPSISDNCGIQSVTNNALAVFELGTTIVTWTVTDVGGNIATAQQQVSVTQEALPTITAPAAISVNTDLGTCTASISDLGTPTVTGENIPGDGISNDAPDQFPLGTTVVTWTVRDGKGNTATATQSVIVTDAELPQITAPVALSVSARQFGCEAEGVVLGEPTVSDNCSVASVKNNAPETFPLGNTTVTWTVTDASGNIATATQTVTVIDEEDPLITAPNDLTVQIGQDDNDAQNVALGQPSVSDNCSVASVTNDAPSIFPLGTTIVTWTITDGSENTATAQQQVTVTKEAIPTITAPADIIIDADEGSCEATGVELGTPEVTGEDIPSDGIRNNAPESFPVGTTTVIWTVIDGNGNSVSAQQTVTVEDKENPVIADVSDITLSNDPGTCSAEIDIEVPTVGDNCDSPPAIGTRSDGFALDAPYPVGSTQITWIASDATGNEAEEVVQTVTVVDKEAPVITAPANISLQLQVGEVLDIELGSPTTSDNCGVAEVSNNAPASFPLGTTTVIWTVTDVNGNSTTAEQNVTVTREILPTITAPADIIIDADEGSCEATGVALGEPEMTGEDIPSNGVSNNAPELFPVGTTTVIWTVIDGNGNTASAEQTVTVEDNEAPVITALTNISIQMQAGEELDVELGTPTTSDNCGVAEVSNNASASFPIGTTTVIWTVTDVNGNTATSNQTVTVLPADTETELPTVTAPANILVDTDKGICEATNVGLGIATITGDIPEGGLANDAPASFPLGETIVTWTVTGRNGNKATSVQKVTVRDREIPTIKAPANVVLNSTGGGIPASEVDLGEPETSDNCSVAEVRNNAPAVFPIGTTAVTWTVVDGSGNTCTTKQKVTVNQSDECEMTAKAKPVVTLKLNSKGKSKLKIEMADDGSTASCGTLKLELSKCDFTCEDIGENTVKLIAKDGKGNRSVAEFKVVVVDESKPKIKVDKRAFVWMMKSGDTFTMPDFSDRVEASDNCGFELHQCPEPGTKFKKAENIFVEFEAKDPSGNKSTDKFRFNLLVFKCKVPRKNGRIEGEAELSDMLFVPWNTSFDKAISEGIVFEKGSDPEFINSISWQMNDYNPLRPGLYRITATLDNEGFEGWNSTVDIPVIVQDKPLPEDIMISKNTVSRKVQSGEIIGSLNTLDPVDNVHTYSMENHQDFYLDRNALVWKGLGTPDAQMTVTVHSTDRAGQTISREIKLQRELAPNDVLIYPNPGIHQSNILVELAQASDVTIRVFDGAGRLVMEEQGYHQESFVRNLDLKGLSSGIYHVLVQIDYQVISKRLVKE